VLVANFLGAFGGDLFLYVVGRYGGRAFLLAGARRFGVSAARIESAEDLIERHGVPLLLFGRYYLLVGRYVPLVCGASRMPFRRFAGYSAVGLAALTILVGLATYFLGQGVNGFAQNPLAAVWVCLAGLGVQLVVLVFTIALRRARRAHARRET
jgi:membrane protein DedA with SNARE-associated domain